MAISRIMSHAEVNGMLTKEQEKTASIEELICCNYKLVVSMAHKFKGRNVPLEDLVQEGMIGLIQAAERYDRQRNIRFSTFGFHYIKLNMMKLIYKTNLISQTNYHLTNTLNIKKALKTNYNTSLDDCNVDDININELSNVLNLSERQTQNAIKHSINSIISIEQLSSPDSNEQTTLPSLEIIMHNQMDINYKIENFNDVLYNNDDYTTLLKVIHKYLSTKEITILKLRFFEHYTLNEIGNLYNSSPAGVKLIIDRSINKLKAKIAKINKGSISI